ncbi:unnamed protein product, partial [Ectocarpus sp. 12 AP-2014]
MVRVLLIFGHVAGVIRLWHIRCRRASEGALEEAKLLVLTILQYTREPLQYGTYYIRQECKGNRRLREPPLGLQQRDFC